MTNLEKTLEYIRGVAEVTIPSSSKATAPSKTGWNDELLRTQREKIDFQPYTREADSLQKILYRFYNLYFFGIVDTSDRTASVVYDAVALARTRNHSIWADTKDNSREPFYSANKSDIGNLVEGGLDDIPEIVYGSIEVTPEEKQQYEQLLTRYDKESASRFYWVVKDNISQLSGTSKLTEENKTFIGLSAFLAMTLLRFATKTSAQMGNAFLKKQYKQNLTSLIGWDMGKAFSPPSKKCLDQCETALVKGLMTTSGITPPA